MSEEQFIPTPDRSGVHKNQTSNNSMTDFQKANPLEGLPMAKTIDGLASTHSRSIGGEVTSALIAGATTQLACDYRELKENYTNLTKKFESQRDDLEQTRTQKAILTERIRSEGKNKHLRNLSITVGTSLLGIGFSFSSLSGLEKYTYSAYGFGIILLLFGWFSGPKGVEE